MAEALKFKTQKNGLINSPSFGGNEREGNLVSLLNRRAKTERVSHALGNLRLVKSIPAVIWILCIMLLLILYSGVLLRLIDPTAAVPDIGILAVLLLAIFCTLMFFQSARLLTDRLIEGMLSRSQSNFSRGIEAFKTMKSWQQVSMYMACYSSFFWGFVVVLSVMI